MKRLILLILIVYCSCASAQNPEADSLKKELAATNNNKQRVNIFESLSYAYLYSFPDTALQYALHGLQLAQSINFLQGEAICINAIGNVYFQTGDNAKALETYLHYLKIKEGIKDFNNLNVAYFNLASAYTEEKDYSHALVYLFKAKKEDEKLKDTSAILYDLYSLGSIYLHMGKTDSALYFTNQCHQLVQQLNDKSMIGAVLNNFGEIYLALSNTAKAAVYYTQSIPHTEYVKDNEVLTANYFGLAKVYKQRKMNDSAVYYARKAYAIAAHAPFYKQAFEVSTFLAALFKIQNKYDSAFYYQQISIGIKDSLFNEENIRKAADLKFREQERQQLIETQKIKYQSKIRLAVVLCISVVFLVIAILLWRLNKQKQKANIQLTEQKGKVENALTELRATQAQLIQSEKMASLGELTAGIAHEIQNPLNFVNNFSEINKEMLEELRAEHQKLTRDEAVENELINDLIENEKKISHHGKRAGAIVKSMMQHSRTTISQKEPVNINELADEALRLSRNAFEVKHKDFVVAIQADFDKLIEDINVVPQDIQRVFLNVFNNAFYALNEKIKAGDENYMPCISVTTRKLNSVTGNSGIEIIIKDNGGGITVNIIDKIFQPFFTTKPTGQGTGLGLSLAYDIIKAHGGEIIAESIEGEGTTFTIQIPADI